MSRFPFNLINRKPPAIPYCPHCGCQHKTHGKFIECRQNHGGYDAPPQVMGEQEAIRYRQALSQQDQ